MRGVSKNAQILMYLNGLIDFPAFEHIHNYTVANPSLLVHDTQVRAAPHQLSVACLLYWSTDEWYG